MRSSFLGRALLASLTLMVKTVDPLESTGTFEGWRHRAPRHRRRDGSSHKQNRRKSLKGRK